MSISFSGSTLTFSDSTTMTTAAVAGPPGPTGPTGTAGPTGPAGSNATVSTSYGAVGTYVTAFYSTGNGNFIRPGCTVSGGCLYRASDSMMNNASCYRGGGMNGALGYYCTPVIGSMSNAVSTSLGLSGTWRTMTTSKSNVYANYYINLWVRVS
jgi:hypothetical protein